MQLNNFNQALGASLGASVNITRVNAATPKKSTLPMVDMNTDRISASTANTSGRASRHIDTTDMPMYDCDAAMKAFFSDRSRSVEVKDYGSEELIRYHGVVAFLKKARVIAERQGAEERVHQANRAVYLIEEKRVDEKIKFAIIKAEKTIKRMRSENARCQAVLA